MSCNNIKLVSVTKKGPKAIINVISVTRVCVHPWSKK